MWSDEKKRKTFLAALIVLLPHFVNPFIVSYALNSGSSSKSLKNGLAEAFEFYGFIFITSFIFVGVLYLFVAALWLWKQRRHTADALLNSSPHLWLLFNLIAIFYFMLLSQGRIEDVLRLTFLSLACSSINFFLILGIYRLFYRRTIHA